MFWWEGSEFFLLIILDLAGFFFNGGIVGRFVQRIRIILAPGGREEIFFRESG